MKTVIAIAALALAALALAADEPQYVTVQKFKDGHEFQAWKPLPKQECLDHIKLIDLRTLPDRGQQSTLACELADTVATKRVKNGNATTKSVYGLSTKTICQQWLVGPLKTDPKNPNVTYTCDKK